MPALVAHMNQDILIACWLFALCFVATTATTGCAELDTKSWVGMDGYW